MKHGSVVLVLILPPTTREDAVRYSDSNLHKAIIIYYSNLSCSQEASDDDKILQETKKDIEFLTSKRLKKQYLSVSERNEKI